ncbi:polyprenyl synthetase family protein [Nocardia vermiculata]|uniref:Polyprenyl synthetase family protein n=1 Tax=Nocardia vermiculata TaxID=257274 RepID=A0A846YAR1_9NOCA|nr:polyprenyl synthetase family protein [Nocardia vermiculata]NKY53859.1 polyprenyl synthetase family protein [Nocardia vermiculata]
MRSSSKPTPRPHAATREPGRRIRAATDAVPGERSAGALLADARTAISPVLRAAVATLGHPLDRMAGYHFGWCDVDGTLCHGVHGKGLRPALALATASACGASAADAVHAAAAVELLHNFSLIHDDVMDADPMRHGRPTVWRVWGTTNATLLGDALQALAFAVLSDGGVPEEAGGAAVIRLARTTAILCHGQFQDIDFETRPDVSVEDYLSMAAGKTAILLGCSCALGALCAGADSRTVAGFNTFGRNLGLAFQLVDDAIDIWGDPSVTGKPGHSDLRARKRSFPIVCALTSGTAAGDELARMYRDPRPMSDADAERAAALVAEAGGRERTQRRADQAVEAALAGLPPGLGCDDLITLSHVVVQRNR